MSIILKALKSSEQGEDQNKPAPAKSDDGFFVAGGGVVKKSRDLRSFLPEVGGKNKRPIILLVVFIVALTGSLLFRHYKGKAPEPALQPNIPAPAVSVQPQVAPSPDTVVTPMVQAPAGPMDPAETAFRAGNFDESIKLYKASIATDPDNAMLHNNLGMAYLGKELYSSAESEFQNSLELNSNCAECFNNFGYLKTILGQTEEAEKYLKKAIAISSSYPDPYFNLAVLYENDGDIGNAVKYYQQFINLYPDKNSQVVQNVGKRIDFLKGK